MLWRGIRELGGVCFSKRVVSHILSIALHKNWVTSPPPSHSTPSLSSLAVPQHDCQTICHFSKCTDQSHHISQLVKKRHVQERSPDCSCHTAPHLPSCCAGVVKGSIQQASKPLNAQGWAGVQRNFLIFEERKKVLRLKKEGESKLRDVRSEAERKKQAGKYSEDPMKWLSHLYLLHQHPILVNNTLMLEAK